ARLKLVVPAIAVAVVHEPNIIDGLREHVVGWPGRRWKRRWSRNQTIVVELKGGETVGDAGDRHVFKGTARWAASRVPHWVLAGDHQVVGEDQSIHPRSWNHIPHNHQVAVSIGESGDVIYGDGVEWVMGPSVHDLERGAAAHILVAEV